MQRTAGGDAKLRETGVREQTAPLRDSEDADFLKSEEDLFDELDGGPTERVVAPGVDEHQEPSGLEDSPHFAQRLEVVGVVMKGVRAENLVEARGAKGQPTGVPANKSSPQKRLSLGVCKHARGVVEPDGDGAGPGEGLRGVSRAAAEVENDLS